MSCCELFYKNLDNKRELSCRKSLQGGKVFYYLRIKNIVVFD